MNVQALSDQVLLNHYLSGDQGAISKLIERHSRRVRDYINMMVKDRGVAEDIFQETFIKAVRVIDDGRYTDNGKFLSWILRIAHNQVIDHFRAQRQNKTVTEAEAGYRGRDGQRADRARRACFGRAAASGTARGGDDALLFRSEFQGYRGTNRREYKYRVGAYALCAYQPATDDQRKKYGFVLIPHNISMGRAFS